MTGEISAELRITVEQETPDGRWVYDPTARYDCRRCGATEGPVTEPRAIAAFAEHVRTVHAGRCHPQTTT
jgi:ribosomal protein S27AE